MNTVKLKYDIPANDFLAAGEASSNVKMMLAKLGTPSDRIKKAAIAMYEAEINAVIHANGGVAEVLISAEKIVVDIIDNGPGIPDLELAMTEGYSTASDNIREMGFGAGMGLPNMKKYADKLDIFTEVGIGTRVTITVYF